MSDKVNRTHKVLKLRIIKPTNGMSWDELGKMLRDVRYRVFRLANLAVSEAYLNFHLFRTKRSADFKPDAIGQLNQRLRKMLLEEGANEQELSRYSPIGAIPDYVASALSQYKVRALTNPSKWRDVVRGKVSLPTFRADMPIPIRCDKLAHRRMQKTPSGDVELELMLCKRPYPKVVLQRFDLGPGQQDIFDRLLDNKENSPEGYRQRAFEIKQDSLTKQWWLYVTYELPLHPAKLNPDIVVGVDLGFSVPIYAAINNGHARLGYKHFKPLANHIRSLQAQIIARRRAIQRGGARDLSAPTARSGHGVKRILLPTEKLRSRIDNAYTTLNHQLSSTVIAFAKSQNAGVIQMENLDGLKDQLRGTFLGARWRYFQLQQFIEYKAKEAGITVKKINPAYTSRRCSKCGLINTGFTRQYRDENKPEGMTTRFVCQDPNCKYEADPDYNAAQNIATIDIEDKIRLQCKKQEIKTDVL
jgi:putative transposase